jgi:hypothetical protein
MPTEEVGFREPRQRPQHTPRGRRGAGPVSGAPLRPRAPYGALEKVVGGGPASAQGRSPAPARADAGQPSHRVGAMRHARRRIRLRRPCR